MEIGTEILNGEMKNRYSENQQNELSKVSRSTNEMGNSLSCKCQR